MDDGAFTDKKRLKGASCNASTSSFIGDYLVIEVTSKSVISEQANKLSMADEARRCFVHQPIMVGLDNCFQKEIS